MTTHPLLTPLSFSPLSMSDDDFDEDKPSVYRYYEDDRAQMMHDGGYDTDEIAEVLGDEIAQAYQDVVDPCAKGE
jgi:hypothetical protein